LINTDESHERKYIEVGGGDPEGRISAHGSWIWRRK